MNRRLFLSTPLAALAPVGEGLGVPGRSTAGDFITRYRATRTGPLSWVIHDESEAWPGLTSDPIRLAMERIN
jgi:hypothetical protein